MIYWIRILRDFKIFFNEKKSCDIQLRFFTISIRYLWESYKVLVLPMLSISMDKYSCEKYERSDFRQVFLQIAQLRGLSDHCPLVLSVDEENWGPRPTRLLQCWRDISGYTHFVSSKWKSFQVEGWGVMC